MNALKKQITDFISRNASFSELKTSIVTEIENGKDTQSVQSIVDETQLIPHLTDDQKTEISSLVFNDDKTLILNASAELDDKTVLATPENDRTVIANIEDDKTVLAKPNSEDTIVDDQTRIQSVPLSTDTDATIASTDNVPQDIIQISNKKLAPGSIINNRFVLENLLGQGGMGSVFKARDLRKEEAQDSNSHIAIKFLNEDFKQHPKALISLQREAKKSQTLAHPNIITVHDFDRDGDTVYMTMEYLDGAPLDEFLFEHKHNGVDFDLAINIINDMCQALSYAHQKNLVHSDFKPGNVFITRDGTAKVLDFGIARAVKNIEEDNEQQTERTVFDAGDLGGLTPSYASCEMLEGKQPSPSDDMYALACVAYELLTGEHPFAKTPAHKARDQNMTPEVIKQLSKKQSNALLHALQFSMSDRTENAQTFIREFFVNKHSSKGLKASLAIAALLLIGVGVKFFLDFQHQAAVEEMVASIQQGNSNIIEKSLPDLHALEGENRETVLADVRPMIVRYYANKALPLADQTKGKYDFPAALSILKDARELYPDSAQLNDLIVETINNQNQLLNTLASQIEKFLSKGKLTSAIVNNDIQDIVDLLNIAAPDSHLLKDQRILLSYVRELKSAIKDDRLKDANTLITSASTLFPNDSEILALKDSVKALEMQRVEDEQLLSLQKQLAEKGEKISEPVRKKALQRHTEKLNALVKAGFVDDMWPNDVQAEIIALDIFSKSNADKQLALRDSAATVIVKKARQLRRSGDLENSRDLLKQAEKISPKLSALNREKRALNVAERKQQRSHASKEKTAKISNLRQTLLNQAKANDVNRAIDTLKQLKTIDKNSRFVRIQATESIANAYIRLAQGFADRNEFKNALNLTNAGLDIAPRYLKIKRLQKAYKAELAILELQQLLKDVQNIDIDKSRHQLNVVKTGLPDRFNLISAELSFQVLEKIKQLAKTDKKSAKDIISTAQRVFPDNREIAALTKRSSNFQSAGGQPCKLSYAGHGKRTRATCYDMLTTSIKAPLMVVVPPETKSSSSFAISKYEISIYDYNQYCTLSKQCKKLNRSNPKLPINNITARSVKDYTNWLSVRTNQQYRLPTDSEWRHAAYAKGKYSKNGANCRLMQGNKQIKGVDLLNTKSGGQNGWGLKNIIGNAQELVTKGNKLYVRGGAHTDSLTQCDIDLKRSHSGKADAITGFRIVKVL